MACLRKYTKSPGPLMLTDVISTELPYIDPYAYREYHII